ncbi:MAG: hypothetical protein V7K98_01975 [Nostoc sp.]|uniref:hypothetical protein n=1 Tax=Nostoc sp. TaxID=1180 RepID=UPI002FFA2A76
MVCANQAMPSLRDATRSHNEKVKFAGWIRMIQFPMPNAQFPSTKKGCCLQP